MSPDRSPADVAKPRERAKPRRRRRWRALALSVLAIGALVALAPTILSSGPLRDRLLEWAGSRLGGRMSAEQLSLSWFGRQEIGGLALDARDGAPVSRVGRFSLDQGLWDLLWNPGRIGPVAVADAEVRIENLKGLALARPPQPKAPEKPEPEKPAPEKPRPPALPLSVEIRGLKLRAKAATIHVAEANFRTGAEADSFDARLEVDHKDERGGATVTGRIQGLSSDFRGLQALGVQAETRAEKVPVSALMELLAALGTPVEGGGTLSGSADLARQRTGKTTLQTAWTADRAWATGDALSGDRVELDRIALEADLAREDDTVTVSKLTIESPVANASAQGTFDLGRLLAAPEAGAPEKPAARAAASVTADLAALARMLPKTLGLHEDVAITGGRLEAALAMQTSATAGTLQFKGDLTDLAGRRGDRPIALSPIHLEADLARDGEDLRATQILATGAFGRIAGRGSMKDFVLDANLLLDKATGEVEQFVDLKGYGAGGTLTANVRTRQTTGEDIRVDVGAQAADLRLALGGERTWREPRATLAAQADLDLDEKRNLLGARVKEAALTFTGGTLRADADVRREEAAWKLTSQARGSGDVEALAGQVSRFLGGEAANLSGRWQLTADAAGTLGRSLAATIRAETADLAYAAAPAEPGAPARPAALGDAALAADLAVDSRADARLITVKTLRLDGPGTTVRANGTLRTAAAEGASLQADGKTDARCDLDKIADMVRALGLLAPGSRLGGTVALDARVATRDDRIVTTGALKAKDIDVLLAGTEATILEPEANIPIEATYEPQAGKFALALEKISSKAATGKVTAALELAEKDIKVEAATDLVVDGARLRGMLGRLLDPDLKLAGSYHVTGKVAGPMPREAPSWNQRIAGLSGGGVVKVGSFTFRGLEGGEGEIRWTLSGGQLVLPPEKDKPAALKVNQGTVHLAGQVDLGQQQPRFTLTGPHAVVERAELTGDLAEQMLVYVSPLIGYSVTPTGRLSVVVESVDLPLGPAAAEQGRFKGELAVDDFRTRLKGPLALVAEAAGIPLEAVRQRFGPVPIDFRDGLFHLENQTLRLRDDFDLRASGTVAARGGALSLMVGVPLTESLLKRAGVPVRTQPLFAGRFVWVPVTGTVKQPRFDEGRLAEAVLQTVRDIFLKPGRGLEDLKDILEGVLKKPEEPPAKGPPAPAPPAKEPQEKTPPEKAPPEKPRDPLLDLLDLLTKPKDEKPAPPP